MLGLGAVVVLLAGCSTASVIKDVFGNDSTPAATTSMGLTGGAMSPGSDAPARGDPVAELYNAGLEKLKAGSYKSAAKMIEMLVEREQFTWLEALGPHPTIVDVLSTLLALLELAKRGQDQPGAVRSVRLFRDPGGRSPAEDPVAPPVGYRRCRSSP